MQIDDNVYCSMTRHSALGESRTEDPSISSQCIDRRLNAAASHRACVYIQSHRLIYWTPDIFVPDVDLLL